MTFTVDEKAAEGLSLNGQFESTYFLQQTITIEGKNIVQLASYSWRFVIFLSYESSMTFKNPYVDINLPFGAYYVENVGKTAYEMSPPSEKQMAEGIEYIIEQELLELENNPPEQTGESQDLSSKSIPAQWSIE